MKMVANIKFPRYLAFNFQLMEVIIETFLIAELQHDENLIIVSNDVLDLDDVFVLP